MCTLNILSFTR